MVPLLMRPFPPFPKGGRAHTEGGEGKGDSRDGGATGAWVAGGVRSTTEPALEAFIVKAARKALIRGDFSRFPSFP